MKTNLFVFVSILFCLSCEQVFLEGRKASNSPSENLEYLWTECNEKYAYFPLKNVDWDAIKLEYAAKVYEGMPEDSLFNVMGAMLKELKDDHANLISEINVSFFGVEYKAQDNFDWRIIVDHYLSQDYYITGPFSHNFLAEKQIAYIRLSSFRSPIKKENLDFIFNKYKDTKGMILDLRENGGGAISNVFTILSRFVDSETLVNYSVIKSGPGHNDFSDLEPVIVKPYNGPRYKNKVVVLTDRGTYSSGSLLSLATKALPNMILVGDTTGGGLGMPNGGQLPNGWSYRFSVTKSLTLDKREDFENGVPPDISILLDWNDLKKDEILEKAIVELL